MIAKLRPWAPYILAALLAGLWIRSEIGHRAKLVLLQSQVAALADARAKAADLQGQADIDKAQSDALKAVNDEVRSTDLGTYLRSLIRTGGD